jgi:hypothetical protein
MLRHIAELHAVVGEHRVDFIWNGLDHDFQESCGGLDVGGFVYPDESELRGPIPCHKQVELALLCANLGDIDMEVADRIALEWLRSGLIAGKRLIPWRCKHRCNDERVSCGIIAWSV